jgi:molybdopterin-synthase adenylyltransferase
MTNRHQRNELFFGKAGQDAIRRSSIAIVGVGGLGTHVVQQLALLGTGHLGLIDGEYFDETNRNRYIGAYHFDADGVRKTDLGYRLAKSIDPAIVVDRIPHSFLSEAGFNAIKTSDYVFGCVDDDPQRLILNELCAAYARPYIDLASDISPRDNAYGGRVFFAVGDGCLHCMNQLDLQAITERLADEAEKRDRDTIYGVPKAALGDGGPSVVSINGVVASLGVTEFLAHVTELREPQRLIEYRGHTGKVLVSKDAVPKDCWYCKGIWSQGESADVERYLKSSLVGKL